MYTLVVPICVLGFTGLFLGLGLGVASKKFAVEIDPLVDEIYEHLPKANCGVCGYPGCLNYAKAIVENGARPNACIIGGAAVAKKIGVVLGVEVIKTTEKLVARIHCGGDTSAKRHKGIYEGDKSCRSATLIHGGTIKCSYGCLGFGDCSKVCPFGAITLRENLPPMIDAAKCTSCGLCIKACPKKLIKLVPQDKNYYIACSSRAKGKAVKEVCDVGCIACGLCAKKCIAPAAIQLERNLGRIDYKNCQNKGECFKVCPTKCIQWTK